LADLVADVFHQSHQSHQTSSNLIIKYISWWSLMVFGGFGGRFFPSKPSNFIKLIKPHQIYLLVVFDGLWRFWWQMFSTKAVKPHQTSSNLIKYISWWSLMVFGGFDGRFFPPKPSNLIKNY